MRDLGQVAVPINSPNGWLAYGIRKAEHPYCINANPAA